MTKDASLTIRIPSDLKAALAAAAEQEDRTTSKLVERILTEWVQSKRKRSR